MNGTPVAPYRDPIRIGTMVSGNRPGVVRHIEQVLAHGFESFGISFWQTTAGVDLPALARDVAAVLAGTGAVVSSLDIFGNPLEQRPKDLETLAGWRQCIDAAPLFGCDVVGGFAGRLIDQPIEASIPVFAQVFTPLAQRARDLGVRLAFENCSMGGDWKRGDWNLAHSPDAWELMFEALPFDNVGLEWEPCHQLLSLADPLPQLRRWAKKVMHVHGKDANVHWDVIRAHGIRGNRPWAVSRTPGFGDSDWTAIIGELRRAGYAGSIDIEGWHDPVYRGELEMTGQVHALAHLKRCRGGDFVPNPQ